MQEKYAQLALENTVRLLGIDSPSGYTENAAKYVQEQFAQMGYDAKITRKGGVLIDLGGEDAQDALLLEAHTDTLGGMVAQIKGNGRLRITNVGGMNANNAEAENVRVITKFSGAIDGTVQLCDASVHVNGNYSTTPRTFDTVEVVLDEDVRSAEDVRKLGIDVGDFNTKLKNAQKFLSDGNRVKVSVRFRGREMAHTDIGRDLLNKFADLCTEVATLDKAAKLEGRNMSIFLSPKAGK